LFREFIEALKKYDWEFGFKQIINEEWGAGKEGTVVDEEVELGFLLGFKLITDSPKWRIMLSLLGRRKIVAVDEKIEDLLDEGAITPVPGLHIWVQSNASKNIYAAYMSAPLIPFKRLTLRLRNESGSKSTIRKMRMYWVIL